MTKDKIKITVESNQGDNVIECDGIAGVTFVKEKDGYENQIILVGKMNVKDMIALHEVIEEQLLTVIKKEVVQDYDKQHGLPSKKS